MESSKKAGQWTRWPLGICPFCKGQRIGRLKVLGITAPFCESCSSAIVPKDLVKILWIRYRFRFLTVKDRKRMRIRRRKK